MNLKETKNIYCCGIGGIGLSGLAQLLQNDGKLVSGSDCTDSPLIDKLRQQGVRVTLKQNGKMLGKNVDLIICSDAISQNHRERLKAKKLGIPVMSYFEAVGEYMKEFKTVVAVSGTHGKTTTTAMIGNILIAAGLNPTILVGSIVREFNSNAHYGSKDFFVVEACEHQEHMLKLHPKIVVLTNIEEDHLDYYRDLEHIVMTFQKYINRLAASGLLIKNVDDSESKELGCDCNIITYGISERAKVKATQIQAGPSKQNFFCDGVGYELSIPGKFNIYNALAAIALSKHLRLDQNLVAQTLAKFQGAWRRFQILGEYRGATIISDYAHHPTAIHSTISGAQQFFPRRRIVAVFQPHQRSRTKKLFTKFASAFTGADFVIIQEIYDVVGRERKEDKDISSRDLVKAVERNGRYALFTKNARATRKILDEIVEEKDVVIIMGAGDIYLLAENLV